MLYTETSPNTFAPWQGEPINGIRYPRAIATNWPDGDLAAIGLYRPADADPVPEGKIVTGQSVQRVDGVVKWVYDLENAPEPIQYIPNEISRRQFYEGLANQDFITEEEALDALSTGTLPTPIQSIIDNLEDSVAFSAKMHLIGSLTFSRLHPLVPIFALSQGMTEGDIDNFWLYCSTLE